MLAAGAPLEDCRGSRARATAANGLQLSHRIAPRDQAGGAWGTDRHFSQDGGSAMPGALRKRAPFRSTPKTPLKQYPKLNATKAQDRSPPVRQVEPIHDGKRDQRDDERLPSGSIVMIFKFLVGIGMARVFNSVWHSDFRFKPSRSAAINRKAALRRLFQALRSFALRPGEAPGEHCGDTP
jgi:hypothetical protein